MSDARWTEIEPSEHPHERAALAWIRERIPDADPWRAWSNFTFIDGNGRPSEVDLMVVAPSGVHLIEIKSHPDGRMVADTGTWTWEPAAGGRKTFDNPHRGNDLKAKKLKSLLLDQKAFRGGGPRNANRLWVLSLVFLSSSDLRIELHPRLEGVVFGPGQADTKNTLPDLIEHLKAVDAHRGARVNRPLAAAIVEAMSQADIRQSQRYRQAGAYRLVEILDESDTWVDFRAAHRMSRTERRVRLHVLSRAADEEEQQILLRAAEREFRLLGDLRHPAIDSPEALESNPRGVALVYPLHRDAVRLDHWLADHEDVDLATRLGTFREIAEAVAYAHEHGLTHRSLSPRRIWMAQEDERTWRPRLRDWSTIARDIGATATSLPRADGTRHLTALARLTHGATDAYLAPELRTVPNASGRGADVFALGCLLYMILTGQDPALDGDAMQQLLDEHGHVPLSNALDAAPSVLSEVVAFATEANALDRYPTVAALTADLDIAIDDVTASHRADLLSASKGTEVAGWRIHGRIGSGASSVVLLAERSDGSLEVLKVARDADQAQRLRDEHGALARLHHPAIIPTYGVEEVDGYTVLRLEAAQVRTSDERLHTETLASRLAATGPPQIDLLQRWGTDLLDALVHMEREGVNHRDLKPENLVFVERGKYRRTHLAVIDFSLASSPIDDIRAGTIGYLDPFLPDRVPRRWDLNAERYAAAVVLAELATGERPSWGADVDPRASRLDVPILRTRGMDPSITDRITAFLQRGLHRDPAQRFDTADEMRDAWGRVFSTVDETTQPGDTTLPVAELDLSGVTAATPIGELGLAPRYLAVVERLGVSDAGSLARVSGGSLTAVEGVGKRVLREVRALVGRLRDLGLADEGEDVEDLDAAELDRLSIDRLEARLVPSSNLEEAERSQLHMLLGSDISAHDGPWPTITATAAVAGVERGDIVAALERARRRWAERRPELTIVREELVAWLTGRNGIATGDEAAELLLARRGSHLDDDILRMRRARAVVRAAAEAEQAIGTPRFRPVRAGERLFLALDAAMAIDDGDRIEWVADPLVDAAVALADAADALLEGQHVATPDESRAVVDEVELSGLPEGVAFDTNQRLRLAAAVSPDASLSSRGELYRTGLPAVVAVQSARLALLDRYGLTPANLVRRIRARFPSVEELPRRPDLDRVLSEAEAGLEWDPDSQRYRIEQQHGPLLTSGTSAATTYSQLTQADVEVDATERILDRLAREGGYVAATVSSGNFERAAIQVARAIDGACVSLDHLLLSAMRRVAEEAGAAWPVLVAADGDEPTAPAGQALRRLVEQAAAEVESGLRTAGRRVVATDLGLLARYGQMGLIDRIRDDLTHSDRTPEGSLEALVVLVPDAGAGATVDGVAVPVVGASQTTRIASAWLERRSA